MVLQDSATVFKFPIFFLNLHIFINFYFAVAPRNPFCTMGAALTDKVFDMNKEWGQTWNANSIPNSNLVDDPFIELQDTVLPGKEWKTLNRFGTGQGRCCT